MLVIADSSCLIALLNVGRLELLEQVYGAVVTTPTVAKEVKKELPSWISIIDVQNEAIHTSMRQQLDPGEASALALAHEVWEPLLILDDLAARKVAEKLNFPIIGTLGVLEEAKAQGIIPAVRPLLEALKAVNFRISKVLEDRVLARVGEL
ncbi:MAG: DUF3368 domain-containing protein [Sphingobacteriaceae bacterium]|nr:DUF3368 domain-containing protein [Cytophagaceae bacterium]